jgi:hypothetical protein
LVFVLKNENRPRFSGSGAATSSFDFSMTTGAAGAARGVWAWDCFAGVTIFSGEGGVGLETGLVLGIGFGTDFCVGFGAGFLVGEDEGGRGGGSGFFDVGMGGFLAGGVFLACETLFFWESKNAFFLAASESAAPLDVGARGTLTSRRIGKTVTRNRENTGDSSAGRIPCDEWGFAGARVLACERLCRSA